MAHAYALIHEEDGTFGASFPDFPGAVTSGRSMDEVIRKAAEALTFHVAGMVEDADPLPMLRSLSELRADAEFHEAAEGAVVAVVPFDLPTRAVRINISIDEGLLGAVDRAAEAAGQSRSAFLADAARHRIRAA
jgi:predicted RNase H-like HicB family nuclease